MWFMELMRGQSRNNSRMLLGGSFKLRTRETILWKNPCNDGCSCLPSFVASSLSQEYASRGWVASIGFVIEGFGHELGPGLDDF